VRLKQRPLGVGQIACVALNLSLILPAGGFRSTFCASMIALPQPSCYNRLKSLNSFSVSLLAKKLIFAGLE